MDYKNVIYEKDGGIATITLNRPEKLNALDFLGDGGITDDFYGALDEAAVDDELKVVIIKGAGSSFCTGHDLGRVFKVYEELDEDPGKRRPSQRARLSVDRRAVEKYRDLLLHPRITIAQIHGYCVGEGKLISDYCDISIAAEDAQIGFTETELGPIGSWGTFMPLFLSVGYKRARWLGLMGEYLTGREAEDIGLISKAVSADKLDEEVLRVAKKLSLHPKDGIAIGKACHHLLLDILGISKALEHSYITHSLFTNMRLEPEEFNFLKERKGKGARKAFHNRGKRFKQTD